MTRLDEIYRITSVTPESKWWDRQSQILTYRGLLKVYGSDGFFGLEMIDGPLRGQLTFINHCTLRPAVPGGVCRCPVHPGPHRPMADCTPFTPEESAP